MKKDKANQSRKEAIDANLRRVFQPTLEEDVPDRFHDLLKELQQKELEKSESSSEDS